MIASAFLSLYMVAMPSFLHTVLHTVREVCPFVCFFSETAKKLRSETSQMLGQRMLNPPVSDRKK
jgi:hypothetical protein